jgi:hypothetical protein
LVLFLLFFTQERHALPDSPDHLTATWKDQCDAYRVGDDTFATYVLAISHYATALGAFAADNQDAGASLTALTKQVGGSVVTSVAVAGPYKSILSGVGEPLGRVESVLQARWKADTIGSLVDKTDPDIQVILAALHAYVVAIQKAEIRDARESLLDLVAARQTPSDVSPPLGVEVRVSTAFIEVELEARLREYERRLAALARLIENLQAAHARLARGWAAGETVDGAATLREINSMAERLEADFMAFENPVKGAGS